MTTPSEALEKVRDALDDSLHHAEILNWNSEGEYEHLVRDVKQALALIPIIEANMLPELPEGILIHGLTQCYEIDENGQKINGWEVTLFGTADADGFGPTPRAAVLAAIEKVRG